MATFYINGAEVTVAKKQKLLRYLRDELHLTSVKDGCSEGACGACTVLINGEPCRACVPDTERLDGKHILTVEGLSDFEKAAYTFAFGEAGAVQCGFCIPGMVLCAKALLDRTPDPTEEQIRWAIRNNYCRCTGYVKIVEAIRLAGKILREKKIPLPATTDWKIGSRVQRLDVEEKVLGTGKYPDDYYPEKMCYGSAVRSKYPRARVLSIDTSKAAALPGVICVLTAADVPGENIIGHIVHDWDVMVPVGGVVHFLGDALALVAAETPEILEKAKKLVKVEYEILPAVHNPEEAAAPYAPLVHRKGNLLAHKHVSRGNAEEAIAHSKFVVQDHFSTPFTEHAFLEPECAVAVPDGDGIRLYTTDQSAHTTLHEVTMALGLPPEKVKNILEEIHKRCDNDSFLLTGTKYPIRPFIDSVYAVCGAPSGFSIAIKEAECEGLSLPFMKEYDFSIKAKGDSMINRNNPSRSIRESDIVVCRLWKSRSHVRWGEVYALATSEGVVIKKLQESEKDGHIKCVSFNTEDGFTPYDLPVEEIYDWAIVVGVVSARNWN